MANKNLFKTKVAPRAGPQANAINEAGGTAYRLEDEAALALYAATGCLNGVYYMSAEMQLSQVLKMCSRLPAEVIARTAIYARQRGYMKDMPALLCAVVAVRAPELLEPVFLQVVDGPRVLRTFVQIIRSGVAGRKSLGTLPKRLVRDWLERRSLETLLRSSVGEAPSLADIVKMVHPKPTSPARAAFYGWLLGRSYDAAVLPPLVRYYIAFCGGQRNGEVPSVPMQLLASQSLTQPEWAQVASTCSWQTLRMNLNTFHRHGVFENAAAAEAAAERLRDPLQIRKARLFPYQLLTAYKNATGGMPFELREGLQDAMEIAVANVPKIPGKVFVCLDMSGSMSSPVTGDRGWGTTTVTCLDAAALVAAAILRKNKTAEVIPFNDKVVPCRINPRDSVMTNAEILGKEASGGTACSAPLKWLNERRETGDLVIFVSDNQSWVDTGRIGSETETMRQWVEFKKRNPQARMVCIDIQPYATVQAKGSDIIHVGGFSDLVFGLLAEVAQGHVGSDWWVQQIRAVSLDLPAQMPKQPAAIDEMAVETGAGENTIGV